MDANKIERIAGHLGRFSKVRNTSAERSSATHLFEGGRVKIVSELLTSYGTPAAVILWVSDPEGNVEGERHIFRIDSSTTTNRQIGEFFEEVIGRNRKDTAKAKALESSSKWVKPHGSTGLFMSAIRSTLTLHHDESEAVRNIVDGFLVKVEEAEISAACGPAVAQKAASL